MEERYVPVRIDPFRRPDLSRHYGVAGWPALVVVDTAGRSVAAAVDPPADRVRLFLSRIHHHLETRPQVVSRIVDTAYRAAAPQRARWTAAQVREALTDVHDPDDGGFGRGLKALEWPVLLFLLDWHERSGDAQALALVEEAVDRALRSPLWDGEAGGMLVYSYTPDWQTPHGEKDAADQAGLLLVLGRLPHLSGERAAAAVALVAYLRRELLDPADGLFRGRQVRRRDGTWWTDPVVYAGRHALLARGLLQVAARLGGPEAAACRDLALAAVDSMARHLVDGEGRVHDSLGPGAGGLVPAPLGGQILVAQALQEGAAATGRRIWQRTAAAVLAQTEAGLWDESAGLFRPGPEPEVEGLVWPEPRARLDDLLPAPNALAALVYAASDGRERSRSLVAARPPGPPGRAHATWGRAMLACEESEASSR